MSRLSGHVSVLQLRFLILDGQADWPVVQVLVDGREAFADGLPGWQGFDPADMLGNQSPLLPEDGGHRVAVYRCSCGIAGCGVIAPVVMPSPDGRRVSWVDFREYTGVFDGPGRAGRRPVRRQAVADPGPALRPRPVHRRGQARLRRPFLGDPAPHHGPPGRRRAARP